MKTYDKILKESAASFLSELKMLPKDEHRVIKKVYKQIEPEERHNFINSIRSKKVGIEPAEFKLSKNKKSLDMKIKGQEGITKARVNPDKKHIIGSISNNPELSPSKQYQVMSLKKGQKDKMLRSNIYPKD